MDNFNKSFEEQLQQKLHLHEVEPPTGMWEAINKQQKKKRFFWLFKSSLNVLLALDVMLMAGFGSMYLNVTNKSIITVENTPNTLTKKSLNESVAHHNMKERDDENLDNKNDVKAILVSDKNVLNDGIAEIRSQAGKTTKFETKTTAVTAVLMNDKLNGKQTSIKSKKETSSIAEKQEEQNKNNTENLKITEAIEWALLPIKNIRVTNELDWKDVELASANTTLFELLPSIIKSKSKKQIAQEQISATKQQQNVLSELQNSSEVTKDKNVTNASANNAPAITKTSNAVVEINKTTNDEINPTLDSLYERKKSNLTFAADLVFSPDYAWRQVKGNNASSEMYTTKRDSAEKVHFAFSAAFRLTCFINDKFYVQSGISYSKRNEKFSINTYQYSNELYVDSTQFQTIRDPFEPVVIVKTYDTSNYVRTTVTTLSSEMVYTSFDIPLSLGYKLTGNKASIAFQAGAAYNLAFTKQGTYINVDEETAIKSKDKNDIFKTKLGLSLIASVAVDCKLTNKFSLLIEPNARYILKSINQANQPIQSKFYTIGLYAGLRYKF